MHLQSQDMKIGESSVLLMV